MPRVKIPPTDGVLPFFFVGLVSTPILFLRWFLQRDRILSDGPVRKRCVRHVLALLEVCRTKEHSS